jgi:glycosyltransferase involved in cell wall biosynthesis
VGDVTPNKNLPRIIEAINKTNYNLVIVGKAFANEDFDRENVWNKDLKKAKELSLGSKKIVSLGFVEDSDLVKIYNIASTLVMPSLYEGFGLPILEAMQSGCPVITSKRGSLGEVGMDAALYVDPLSVDSIASGINKVMGDANLRKSLSQAGIKNAKKFTWEKTAIETYDVYKSILK